MFCLFYFTAPAIHAQSIKNKIEDLVDGKQKSLKEKEQQEAELRAAQRALMMEADTTRPMLDEVFDDPAEYAEKEKSNFKDRNQLVKKRAPGNGAKFSEEEWQKLLLIRDDNVYKEEHKLDSTKHVFGWHPYWMGNSYNSYNFSLLSTVAYFSYELDPLTGKYTTIHQWSTTSLIDSAHKHNCKVVLSVTNFGSKNNNLFLSNLSAQKTFINTLITLLRERNADGVNIDFENVSGADRNKLTNFIIDLSERLKAARKDYLVTMALPAFDFDNAFDTRNLKNYVDLFVIMGYEFHGQTSRVAGPVAPISSGNIWWEFNLERSLAEYLVSGVPSTKLLMGLPYYGAEWHTEDLMFPSKAKQFIRYPMYRNIMDQFGKGAGNEDDVSQSRFYVYRDNNNRYRQIWFEDSTSLAKKYDWVKSKKLGGVGIWALGYDNGYTELWKLLAEKFAIKEPEVKEVLEASTKVSGKTPSGRRLFGFAMRMIRNPKTLLTNPRPLVTIFGAFFGISVVGFLMIYRYGYRLRRVSKLLIQSTLTLFIILAIALIFIALKYLALREVAWLIGGFVVGCIMFLLYSRHFLTEKDLP
ncbi:MAG: glycosyl hydrolase family 18 protein [Cytophagaceae bacterium]